MAAQIFKVSHFRYMPNLKRQRVDFSRVEVPQGPSGVSVEDFVHFQHSAEEEISKLKSLVLRKERELTVLEKTKQENARLKKELASERRPFQKAIKKFSELHRCSRYHKTQDIKKWLSLQLKKLPEEWQPEKINLKVGEESVKFSFGDEGEEKKESDELFRVQRALKAKDEGNISDAAYHEMKQVPGANLPPINQIKAERKKQNAVIPITELDKDIGIAGCIRSIRDIMRYLLQNPEYAEAFEAEEVILRYAGDGRRTTKKLGSTMATFSIPKEKDRSPDKEYCISLYDGPESYENLGNCMSEVFREMDSIRKEGVFVNQRLCKIKWVMCSDWKYMAAILGINAPCSDFFCLWCHCFKALIKDFSITDWPISRTIDECYRLSGDSVPEDEKFGVKHRPLVKIEFTDVIPDTLHLKLRIRGKLLNQVACWAIQQKKRKEMENAMEEIGLHFRFTDQQDESSGKKVTKWTSFDCDDLEKVVKRLDLPSFLSNMEDKSRTSVDCLTKAQLISSCKKYNLAVTGTKDVLRVRLTQHLKDNNIQFQMSSVQNLEKKMLDVVELAAVWKEFEVLADALTSRSGEPQYLAPETFKTRALQWGKDFRKATFDEDVIPYIHVFIYHVPQFLKKFGSICNFNCQTVEKKNHLQNKTFNRASQKSGKNSNYTVQVMERENRQMFARVNNIGREKRSYNKK